MKTVYIHGILLDGSENMVPQTGMAVITEGEKIIAIEPQQSAYEGAQVVDLKGQYIMPGLINLHVHLPANGKPKKKQSDPKKLVKLMTSNNFLRKIMLKMCEGYAKTQLMSGVTTIRTVGGVEDVDTKIRDAVLAGKIDGPRILAGNMAISVPGGHMAGSLAYEATSPEQARSFVRQIAKDKPDLIKLMITGGVLDAKVKGEPGELKMSPEIVKAACEEAHALGLQVAAHVESPQGVQVALENGIDTIEHGAMPSAEIIQLFKDRKACQVATLSPALPYALFDRAVSHVSEMEQYNGKVVLTALSNARRNVWPTAFRSAWARIRDARTSRITICGGKSTTSISSAVFPMLSRCIPRPSATPSWWESAIRQVPLRSASVQISS